MTTMVKRNDDGSIEYFSEPMGIRDYFAMAALPNVLDVLNVSVNYKDAADKAYLIADQMMIRRNKGGE